MQEPKIRCGNGYPRVNVILLHSCNTHRWIHQGRQVHLLLLKKGLINSALTFGNHLIQMYVRCGSLSDAWKVFKDMPERNCFSWNTIIEGYMKSGNKERSLQLFDSMPHKNEYSWNVVVSGFAKADSANHALNMLKEPDDFSLSALISGYANCGRMNDARRIFDSKSDSCVVLWNSIISGYVYNNEEIEALIFFNQMRRNGVQEDSSTLASVLSASSNLGTPGHSKQMHTYGYKVGLIDDVIVASALVDAYSKCGSPYDACKLFSELKYWDTILLNSMITVYSNCGKIEDAKCIFKMMPNKSLISWNSMIVALSQNGCAIEALDLLCEMSRLKLRMDKFSLASAISACASISSLELGEQLFARATVIGLDYYSLCTSPSRSKRLESKDLVQNSCFLSYEGKDILSGGN
nr:putative pentatricopeptide repeat-containing protein, mitochondrial [Quercus suber]